MIVGVPGLVAILICGGIFAALMVSAVRQAKEAARRTKCNSHFKQLGLALHNYRDAYGCFPPAYIADEAGKPMHSWRVLILPFIDQQPLYAQYRFDEPWDSPHNSSLLSPMPYIFRCPSDTSATETATNYVAVFGPNCVFRGTRPVSIDDIKDGTGDTFMIGETKGGHIPWIKPEDVDVTRHPSIGDPTGFGSFHALGVHFSLCDGSVRFVAESISLPTLQALYTIDGGETVGEF